jgi:hypothetical protein
MKKWLFLFFFPFIFACSDTKQEQTSLTTLNIVTSEWLNFDHYVPGKVEFRSPDYAEELDAYLKLRGGMSVKYEKKSISLKIGFPFFFNQGTSNDEWILNANYIDKTFLRHKMAYDIFRAMSVNNHAPSCSYVQLYRNGINQGIYVLMQRLNTISLGIGSTGFIFKEPALFADNESIIEIKRQKYPVRSDSSAWLHIRTFRDFLFDADDATFRQEIGQYLDLESVADWYLLLLFSNNGDGVLKNYYIYQQRAGEPMKIAPWDYDHSWGRDGDNELNMHPDIAADRSILFERLQQHPKFRALLSERWQLHRAQNVISMTSFEKLIHDQKSILQPVLHLNTNLWPDSANWYFDHNNFDEEIEIMMRFAELNIQQLDSVFSYTEERNED